MTAACDCGTPSTFLFVFFSLSQVHVELVPNAAVLTERPMCSSVLHSDP